MRVGFGVVFAADESGLAAAYHFGLRVFFTLGATRPVTLRDAEIVVSGEDVL